MDTMIIRLEDAGLNKKAYNCLRRAGINTLNELEGKTLDDLLKIRNLGFGTLRNITRVCEMNGITTAI